MLAGLLSLLAACGSEPGGLSAEPQVIKHCLIKHCQLERHGEVRPAKTPAYTRHCGIEQEGWELLPNTERLLVVDSPPWAEGMNNPMVLVSSKGAVGLQLIGPFDGRAFNSLHIELGSSTRVQVGVHLMRGGERVAASKRRVLNGNGHLALGRFDFPSIPKADQPIDAVRILFAPSAWHADVREGMADPVAVGRVLFKGLPKLWLLPPQADSGLLNLDQDYRVGLALTDGVRLRIPMPKEATRGGYAELRFAAGVPSGFCAEGDEPELVLVAADVEFFRAPLSRGGWQDFVLPAPDVDDVWITLDGGTEGARLAYFANPRLIPGPIVPKTVLLVTSDTHRADHLGCVGKVAGVATPHLDALARLGTRFDNCWSTTNVTTPSHVSILTGLSPKHTGVLDNTEGVSERALTLAEVFREAGYETWAVVSVPHLGPEVSGLAQGFDRYVAPVDRDNDLADSLPRLENMLDAPQTQNRFIWLHLFDAHAPYDPPAPWRAPADGEDQPPLEPAAVPTWNLTAPSAAFLLAQYRGEVSYLDAALGDLFARPDLEDALVIFTADHGESLGNHSIWWDHQGIYPDTLHVPLIFKGPGIPAGIVRTEAVQLSSLASTVAQLSLGSHRNLPGGDILGEVIQTRPRFALSAGGHQACVEFGGKLLIMQLRAGRERRGLPFFAAHQVRLFDWALDPSCSREISSTDAETCRVLRRRLLSWLRDSGSDDLSEAADLDAEARRLLDRLGYGGGSGAGSDDLAIPEEGCDCPECLRFT